MANYIIEWTDKRLKSSISLHQGVIDESTTSLTLYGKNASNWGQKNEENLIHLLEHFASNGTPPRAPTKGQLWYNSKEKKLKVYWDDTWNDLGYRKIASPTVPPDTNPGALWFDTANNVLKVRNKAGEWITIVQHHIGTVTPTPIPIILPTPTPAVVVGNAVPLSLPTAPLTASGPVVVTADNQIIQNLYIVATQGTAAVIINGFNNIVIRNCYIVHDQGPGVELRNSKFITIDHTVIDCTGAPTFGPHVINSYNIHAQNCPNLVIGHVELYDGSTGVFLQNCQDPRIYSINGFNFRGPSPRGEFISMHGCNNAVVEDFYNAQDLSVGWNDSNIYFKNCSNFIVRRGCLDGSNGVYGAGVYTTYDNAIASGGLVEHVDAINMGNGAFGAAPGQNITFRHCRVKNNHTEGVGGRPAPYSGGLIFHGIDGNHDLGSFNDPNNIATNLKIEGCILYNLANPNTIVFDRSKFTQIDYIIADFSPRTRIYIQNMPQIGGTPAPVGTPLTPSPIWSPGPTPVAPGVTPTPTFAPTVVPGITPTFTPTPLNAPSPTPAIQVSIKPKAPNPDQYNELIFNEDFNGAYSTQIFMDHYWYEGSDPRINYSIENGELLIWPENNFVDRHINTDGKWEFRYGFVEWEAKLPYGAGTWPALWLYAHPGDDRPEIDVMEAYPGGGPGTGWGDSNLRPTNFGLTVHKANGNYSWHEVAYAKKLSDFGISTDLSSEYHTYGVKWTSNEITFFFDGEQLGQPLVNDGYWSKPMFLLMSLQFGSASGQPNSSTPLGKSNAFRIKYMRAWSLANGSTLIPMGKWLPSHSPTTTPAPGLAPTPTFSPGPTVPTPTVGSSDPRPQIENASVLNQIGAMTFREEFEGNSLNTSIWRDELFDDNPLSRNYNITNSCLNIWPEAVGGQFFRRTIHTGGQGQSNGSFYQKYGYFEARMKLNRGRGCWPAFWLYSHEVGWNTSDTTWLRPEIDFMEAYPGGGVEGWWGTADFRPTNFGATVWRPNVCDRNQSCHQMIGDYKLSDVQPNFHPATSQDLSADFHIYGGLWDNTGVQFFFDGRPLGNKIQTTEMTQRMYILLDLWFGSASGQPSVSQTPQGATNAFSVDYVRAWGLNTVSTELSGSAPRYVPNIGGGAPVAPTPGGSGGFSASVTQAPASGSTVTGTISLQVTGSSLGNVELLPNGAYLPMYGRFNINGGTATLNFDTRTLGDGNRSLRIVAWDSAPGSSSAQEIVVGTFNWNFSNGVVSTPTFTPTPAAPASEPKPYGRDPSRYTGLTFQDEFNGSTIDTNKWNTKLWYDETNNRNNWRVQNGSLYMWAERPFIQNNRSFATDGKFEQQFGYFECRAILNKGRGQWPAFWLYWHKNNERPELDIMEAYPGAGYNSWWSDHNLNPVNYGVTIHKARDNYAWHQVPFETKLRDHDPWKGGVRLDQDWHYYGMHWDASGVQFYFDGQPLGNKWSDNDGYFHRPMYVILDLWLGSASGSPNDQTITGIGNSYIVDYVRVWQIR